MTEQRYMVFERAEEWEQALVLRTGKHLPDGGILDFPAGGKREEPRATFESRSAARAAISRTDHYRLAFGFSVLPEKRFCFVVPVIVQ